MYSYILLCFALQVLCGHSLSVPDNTNRPRLYNIQGSGWASPTWNWGSAIGTGHDCAKICRQDYATSEAREALIENLLETTDIPENFEVVKLVLALVVQKANNFKPWGGSALASFSQVLDAMVEAERYEEGDEEICSRRLVQDLQKRFVWLEPAVDDKIAMNLLWYEAEEDYDLARRRCCGLTLKGMDFVDFGL